MSRRRSRNPTKAISITLPQTLLDELDDQLSHEQSRSAWIARAINAKLHGETSIDDATNLNLLWALRVRGVLDVKTYEILIASL